MNLIWGIEAFHRKRHAVSESATLAAKISRIVEQITEPKDKKWLKGILRYSHEPALEIRIFDAFKSLPINLDAARLRAFSKSCAELRNDISHFGGPRPGTKYQDFVRDLDRRSSALSVLYHTLLLQEVGVDEKILNWWTYKGFRSFIIKSNFVEVGLLDKGSLKDSGKADTGE